MTKKEIDNLWLEISKKCVSCISVEKMENLKNVFTIAAKYTHIVELFDMFVNKFKIVRNNE